MLKCDFHIHTSEDPQDNIYYSAKTMIKYAAKLKYDVLTLTNHNAVYFNQSLKQYAKKHNILLIPGMELSTKDGHLVLINYKGKIPKNLEKIKKNNSLIMSPHPYHFYLKGLNKKLINYLPILDAIEYSHHYIKLYNPNKRAEKFAKKHKLAILGTADAHILEDFNRTFTLIDTDKNVDSILEAIRKRKTKVITKPYNLKDYFDSGLKILANSHMKSAKFI